jgi:Cd2+/Zn2+-exporting ATPase
MGAAGSDTALESADIALMADDLSQLPFLLRLSRRALATIRFNIWFAVAVKLLAVALVFPGWLTLWLAIMADTGATVLVTLNGMRLLKLK